MVDPTWIHNQFSCRTKIFAVGLNGEVKEILVEAFPNEARGDAMDVDAICLETTLDEKTQVLQTQVFTFSDGIPDEMLSETLQSNEYLSANVSMLTKESSPAEETYLFEPSVTLFAACLQKHIPERFNIAAATPNHHFFVARFPLPAAFGRSLKVSNTFSGSLRSIQQQLHPLLTSNPNPKGKKSLPQLNVTPRDCGMNTQDIKKILQVSDGGNQYLFITRNNKQFTAWLGSIAPRKNQ
jgi:hypothetical protein